MIKKTVAILLIISLVFTFASCSPKQTPSEGEKEYVLPTEIIDSDISLPYTSADSFNPYSAKSSLNRNLLPIMYESLFKATDDGKGKKLLCESFTSDGDKITVKIPKGVKFSNGTALTSADIKYSFEKAKANTYYKSALGVFTSLKIIDNYTVQFNLKYNDLMGINALSFPICKQSGKNLVGTGKYSISYLEKTPYLSVNTSHRDFETSWNKQISLYDMAGITSPVYSFKANDISVYQNDLSTGEYVNLSSKTVSEGMNNLVYIGVNSSKKSSAVSLKWVRQAINIGINRRTVTAASFLGQGAPTVTPFKSGFYALDGVELPEIDGETQNAVNILTRNGYSKVNSQGVRTNGSNSLSVSILVCSKNEYKVSVAEAVKNALNDLGIKATVNKKKTVAEYKEALEKGEFSLYIGEVALTDNCDLSPFFSKSGSCRYGISEDFYKEYSSYKKGGLSTTEFIESFSTEVPFIPLFYRKSVIAINPNIEGVDENSVYTSVSNWKMAKK